MLKDACKQVHLKYSYTRLETPASCGRGENGVRAIKEMIQRQKDAVFTLGVEFSIKHHLFALLVRHSEWVLSHLVRNDFLVELDIRVIKTSPYESYTGNHAPRSTSLLNRILVGRRDDDDKQPRRQHTAESFDTSCLVSLFLLAPLQYPLCSFVNEAPRRGSVERGESGHRSRISEVAMNAVGEDDPTYPTLRDSLKQAQIRPVEDRIKATTSFIERAKRRIGEHQADILRFQEQLAEDKSEEEKACQEANPQPRWICAAELAQLRNCVRELQRERERDELRAKLHSNARPEERERKQPRNLSSSTLELAPLSRGAVGQNELPGQVHWGACGGSSALVETLIDNAESNFRRANRFNPSVDNMRSAGYGLRGVRDGGSDHPETGVVEALDDPTRADSCSGDDIEMAATIAEGSAESSTGSVVNRPRWRLSSVWREDGAADVVWHRDARAAEGVARRPGLVPSPKGLRFLHQSGVSDGDP